MPLIQPTLPATPVRPVARPDTPAHHPSSLATQTAAPKDPLTQETGSKAVEPAAPPSVLQLQIKALISEQAQSLQQASEPDPEGPS